MPFLALAVLLIMVYGLSKVGSATGKRMSENGKNLLRQLEGIRNYVYDDAAGLPTIGIGHLLTTREIITQSVEIDGQIVSYVNGLTLEQVEALFNQDLKRYESAVSDTIKTPLTINQQDALISFTYNIGIGAFMSSTLAKKLNDGQYDLVPDELRRWNKVKGQVHPGLVSRREREVALWQS